MAEFLTMQEAEDKFGKKGKTNAALTLGIIGTTAVVVVTTAFLEVCSEVITVTV